MTIGETIRKAIKEISTGMLDIMSFKNFTLDDDVIQKPKKRKRARKKDGTFRGDDKSTPNVNEAWENE